MINLYSDPHGKKIFSSSIMQQQQQQQQQETNTNPLKQVKNEISCNDNDNNIVMGLKGRINELEHQVQQLKSLQVELH